MSAPSVISVAVGPRHSFSKRPEFYIRLLEGLGVEGDAHCGATVKHRSRVAKDPQAPNLRQVHIVHGELLDELKGRGFDIAPGAIGENITTANIDLLGLSAGTRLHIGADAIVEITGLRNPCQQLNKYRPGLMQAVLDRAPDGSLVRKSGVMAVVIAGGEVRTGDAIAIAAPEGPFRPLLPV